MDDAKRAKLVKAGARMTVLLENYVASNGTSLGMYTAVDLLLFHFVDSVMYVTKGTFPIAQFPHIKAISDAAEARKNVAAYLKSDRRIKRA